MKRTGWVVGLVALLVGCSTSSGRPPIVLDAPPPAAQSATTTAVDGSVSATDPPLGGRGPSAGPSTASPPSAGSSPASAPSASTADPDGIGDVLYPGLGNPGIDVQHYDIDLTYDHSTTTVTADVGIDIRFTERRTTFTLDTTGPQTVDGVTIDDRPVDFARDGGELRITPHEPEAQGAAARVDVRYRFTGDAAGGGPLPAGWFNTDRGSYVLNEPDGASRWLPSNDHPSDKATFRFTVHVPAGVTGVANGELVAHDTSGDRSTWVWVEDEPMATYLIQLLTGDYEIVDTTGPHGLPLTSVVLGSDTARMQPLIDAIGSQITYLEQFFGPYPLDRYGIAVADSSPQVAMETQGRSLFSSRALNGDLALDGPILAHELTHQWFGDAVTPARWKDVWLNESFATYGQWLWIARGAGGSASASLDAIAEQALHARQPGATADPSIDDLFGTNVYDGGAVVLHALRLTIGDTLFFQLLQRWVADNDGASRTTADFIALAEEVSGSDLTKFFDDWLFAARTPTTFPAPAPAPTSPTTTLG
ncbi:MAG: peptidase family protein [Ilumatobacteraceae bacterium]|nr:peptidase family protein [Ilumatobacteraceae bacterium]